MLILKQFYKNFLLATCFLISIQILQAQPDPFDNPTEAFCNPICDWGILNGYEYRLRNNPSGNPGGIPGCGGVLNNDSWFSFVAAGGAINITILPSNCMDVANGDQPNLDVQAALYQIDGAGCPNADIDPTAADNLLCKDDCASAPQEINWNNIQTTRGQQYLIVVDGCSGDVCDLLFQVTGAGAVPFELTEVIDINGQGNGGTLMVCTGTNGYDLTVNADIGSQIFNWTSDAGDFSTDSPTLTQNFPIRGDFQYCVQAATGCDSTNNEFCVTIEVRDAMPGGTLEQTICEGDSYFWMNENFSMDDMFTRLYTDPVNGCRYDTFLNLTVYEENDENPTVIDTSLCWDDEFIFGTTPVSRFNSMASTMISSIAVPACDSFVDINATFINVTVEVSEVTCSGGDFIVFLNNIETEPNDGSVDVFIEWVDGTGVVVLSGSNADVFTTNVEGDYVVYISISRDDADCQRIFEQDINIDASELLPNAAALIDGPDALCGGDTVQYFTPEIPNAESYNWTVTGGGIILNGQGSDEITVDWSNSPTGGDVCVNTVNSCGDGGQACTVVSIIAQPTANFTMPTTSCIEDAVTVTYTGNAPASANYTWNFSGGNIINGGTGQGPYEVRWPSGTTDRTVSLRVDIAGCISEQVVENITLDPALPPLTLNCISSPTDVTFTWTAIPSASGYDVRVIFPAAGVTGTLNGTEYAITGLTSGDSVAVEIITMSSNSCPDRSIILGCIAKECPVPGLTIDTVPPICLNNASVIDLNESYANAGFPTTTATVTWSSASGGITDAITGEFDPNRAGPGDHIVAIVYVDDGCAFNATRTITVFDRPTADFTVDANICEDGIANVIYNGNNPTAEFMWDFDGGTVVSGTDAGPYTIEWIGNAGDKTVSLTVIDRDCASETFSQPVAVEASLLDPMVSCEQNLTSVDFSWAPVLGADSYTVTVLLGPEGTQTGNSYNISNLTPGDSVAVLIEANSSGLCPNSSIVFSCLATDCVLPTVELAMVEPICQVNDAPTVQLNATVTPAGPGTGRWTGPGIIDEANGIFDPNGPNVLPGANIISYQYTEDACTTPPTTLAIIVSEGPDAEIDKTNTLEISCAITEIQLDGSLSTPANATIMWTTDGGSFLSGENTLTPTVNAAGTYTLTLDNNGCQATDVITVGRADDLPTALAGETKTLTCRTTEVTLDGEMSSSGAGITYAWSSLNGGVIVSGGDTPNPVVSAPGTYNLVVSDSNSGCNANSSVEVGVNTDPPMVMTSLVNIIDCVNTVGKVSGEGSETGANIQYVWTTSNGNITGPANQIEIDVDQPGIYTLEVTNDDNGCSDVMDIEMIQEGNTFTTIELDFEEITCFGSNDGLIEILNVAGGQGNLEYSIDNGPYGSSTIFSTLGPGEHIITVRDELGCTISDRITFIEPVQIIVDVGEGRVINTGDSVVLNPSFNIELSDIDEIIWTANDSSIANPSADILDYPTTTTRYVLTIIDQNGCVGSDFVDIIVERQVRVFFPNIFSPNNDGSNDVFKIEADETVVRVLNFQIFNRWGENVFSAADFAPADEIGWDGSLGSTTAPVGVYVFYAQIELDNQDIEVISGDITLVR